MSRSNKRTYKIGEVAELLAVRPSVLRFWETEFPRLSPMRTSKGQRVYTESDLGLIKRIKHLVYQEGYTIDGARRRLEETDTWYSFLEELRQEIEEIKTILKN